MNRIKYIIAACIVVVLSSCSGRKTIKMDNYTFADSTKYALVTIDFDVPKGNSEIESSIRTRLVDIFEADIQYQADNYGDDVSIDKYKDDRDDTFSMVQYYGKSLSTYANFLSKLDDQARRESLDSYSEEEIEEIIGQMMFRWDFDISLKEIDQTDKYIIFSSCDYVYLGGAHGGVTGQGTFTFSKKDGSLVTSFLDPSSEKALQPALKRGLVQYLKEYGDEITVDQLPDYLFLEEDYIPFPHYQPYPTEEGLVFVYQQYEIAPYAVGMPSFLIPYDELEPYYTEEARAILK